jgi:hypothetical protein
MKESISAVIDESAAEWRMPHLPWLKVPEFALHVAGAPERSSIEAYIKDRFLEVHRAHVSHFLPNIISLRCGTGWTAAVGLAPAAEHKLFAESYLSTAVEEAISLKLGITVERRHIIEIGNLVSTWKGSSLLLFIFIAELMDRLGYHWVIFTATAEVRRLLARLHYSPVDLAEADPQVLADGGVSWGSYYNNQPRVMCGDIRPAIAKARKNPMYRAAIAMIHRQLDKVCSEFCEKNQAPTSGENSHE